MQLQTWAGPWMENQTKVTALKDYWGRTEKI